MDGHATHTYDTNRGFCVQNNIDVIFFPPHTSHVIQPLDGGIFAAYKANYRTSKFDKGIDHVVSLATSEATRGRIRQMGAALISNLKTVNSKQLKVPFLILVFIHAHLSDSSSIVKVL